MYGPPFTYMLIYDVTLKSIRSRAVLPWRPKARRLFCFVRFGMYVSPTGRSRHELQVESDSAPHGPAATRLDPARTASAEAFHRLVSADDLDGSPGNRILINQIGSLVACS